MQTASGKLWRALRDSPAQVQTWLDLAQCYADRKLPWQAAYAERQAARLASRPGGGSGGSGLRRDHGTTGDDSLLGQASLDGAARIIEDFVGALQEDPGDWLTWLYLARLRDMADSAPPQRNAKTMRPDVRKALERARQLEIIPGESLHWLGVWRLNAGDAAGAVAALSQLVDLRPLRHGSMMYLGEALLRVGNVAAAESAFTRASLSSNPDFLQTLAARVYANNYWPEAIGILRKLLDLRPDSIPALALLAKVHWEVYELSQAQEVCRRILKLEPGNQDATLMLAALPGRMGDAHAHLAAVQAEYAAGDPQSRLASSIAMASLYHDELSASEVAALHRRLCAPIAAAHSPRTEFANERTTSRRLRIGYVSGDFHRQHPVNLFMLPVLLRHDHAAFEIFVYHTGTMHDQYTRRARESADRWLEAGARDDDALQAAIVADGIDILVDLAGHTSTHRLGVFAKRAAPVQATFLGYPHSTGLPTLDWIIGDAVVTPAAHADLFSEGIAQLPGSVFCWAPVDDYPLPVARPADAPVVFTSFNNAMKLSPRSIALWARVLKALPDSRLLLKAPSFRDEAVRRRFADLFAGQGIARDRIEFRGPTGLADMMQEYGDADIALDPTPYNGGTTTLQALWMGVPVITLAGGNFVSRMGASFLQTLGRPEWVAADEDGYVARAVALAGSVDSLRSRRAELRAALLASPLCDIASYTRHFENLLRRMWDSHCSGRGERLLAVDHATRQNPAHPTSST
ncbi:MAG: hypothetical protein OEL20_14700 [Sulfuritalea sp.]|nr:hypothetical protein [Sulfuritalea sp.]